MVAPYTGAWIEIQPVIKTINLVDVAPYTGAWIEINPPYSMAWTPSRTLHGCVD